MVYLEDNMWHWNIDLDSAIYSSNGNGQRTCFVPIVSVLAIYKKAAGCWPLVTVERETVVLV